MNLNAKNEFEKRGITIIKDKSIGGGSFGTVYKSKRKGVEYAIKEIKISQEDDENQVYKEVELLKYLKHQNIIEFYDSFTHENNYYILMKLMDKSLRNYFNTDLNQKIKILLQISNGMRYLTKENIIHRDLKPENILVKEEEGGEINVKICDFGLSYTKETMSSKKTFHKSTSVSGTAFYISPEIYDDGNYSQYSDVYAFSMIIFQFIEDKSPFSNDKDVNTKNIAFKVVSGKRPTLSVDCEKDSRLKKLKGLMEKCWDQEPKKRTPFVEISKILKEIVDTNENHISYEINE